MRPFEQNLLEDDNQPIPVIYDLKAQVKVENDDDLGQNRSGSSIINTTQPSLRIQYDTIVEE